MITGCEVKSPGPHIWPCLPANGCSHLRNKSQPVPEHLRNAPTRLMKELGYGRDYRYAHDEPDAYAAGENYFPDGMTPPRLYEPTERGLEAKIKARLDELRALDAGARKRK